MTPYLKSRAVTAFNVVFLCPQIVGLRCALAACSAPLPPALCCNAKPLRQRASGRTQGGYAAGWRCRLSVATKPPATMPSVRKPPPPRKWHKRKALGSDTSTYPRALATASANLCNRPCPASPPARGGSKGDRLASRLRAVIGSKSGGWPRGGCLLFLYVQCV